MTIEQRVAVLEEIFSKIQDYYTSAYSGEEIDARLASAGVPIGITKEYKSVAEMNQDFTGTDVQRGQFVLILPDSTASADYGKVYLKGTANWVYAFTLTTLTSIKGPIGPPGKKGDKGDPGEAGSSFAILGYFDTLDALKAAVPNPKAGDVYGVGTAPPYNIYIWDSVHGKWVGNGNLQGPQGKQGIQGPEGKRGPEGKQGPEGPVGGSSNFVRYDASQTLTDEQKAQARTNIGADTVQGAVRYDAAQSLTDTQKGQARANINAAPGGFGIGANGYPYAYTVLTGDTINSVNRSGLYVYDDDNASIDTGLGNYGMSGLVLHLAHTIAHSYDAKQIFYPRAGMKNTYLERTKDTDKGWQPWEYVNPPMTLGVEYRTTERYLGKPVYVKTVDTGALPNATYKEISASFPNANRFLSIYGSAYRDNAHLIPLPCLRYGLDAYSTDHAVQVTINTTTSITISTKLDMSSFTTSSVCVKYTKSTD
mgnify:CR=1 FL=1